jgi:hypothetical protein
MFNLGIARNIFQQHVLSVDQKVANCSGQGPSVGRDQEILLRIPKISPGFYALHEVWHRYAEATILRLVTHVIFCVQYDVALTAAPVF